MDRREIEYVIVIAQEKTLSKAADRLFVSQPALSRFLLKLEDELGLPLFERRKRQLIQHTQGNFIWQQRAVSCNSSRNWKRNWMR